MHPNMEPSAELAARMGVSRYARFVFEWTRAYRLGRAYTEEQFELEQRHQEIVKDLERRVAPLPANIESAPSVFEAIDSRHPDKEFGPDPPAAPSETATTPLTAAPADANATDASESAGMLSDVKPSLATRLKEAQKLSDLTLRKRYEAVIRYNCYLAELRAIKVASKKYQTPDLLKKQFPEFELWAVLDKDDERDIAAGSFDPGRCSWALVKRTILEARMTAP